jgi:transposase-like protein
VDGPYQPQPAIRYTAEQKVTLLAQYHTLRETHPNLTYKQRCRKIGVAHQTVADWLKAARRAEAS